MVASVVPTHLVSVRVVASLPKKSRVDVIGNMPDSESGLKSSSLLLAAMRIGVVGNTRAFDSRVEIYWVRIPHPQP